MNLKTRTRWVLSGLVVMWLFTVSVSYFITHKPFTLDSLLTVAHVFDSAPTIPLSDSLWALLNVLGDALAAAILIFFATALGHRLLRRVPFDSSLEATMMHAGIGLGALGLIVFALAALHVVNVWIYGFGLALGLGLLRHDARAVLAQLRALELPRATRWERALAIFSALALGIAFLLSLTPAWGWDALIYHLNLPRFIIENGGIVAPPDNFAYSFPSLIEMLFLAGMVLKGDGATQPLHWIFLALTCGAMLAFAARYFSWRVGWLAVALLCAIPTMLLLATWAYNDLALMFYTFAAFVMTLRARSTRRRGYLIVAGMLCGFALGEKYTALFVPVTLALFLIRRERAAVFDALLFLAVAVAFGAPWWLRNFVLVGNPIYPFFLGGRDWDAARATWYSRFGTGLIQRPWELLIAPWLMTVSSTHNDFFQATLGPLLLALLPLNLIPVQTEKTARAALRALWLFALALYLPWLLGVAESELLVQSRLLFPAFPLFALLAARGMDNLRALDLPQFSARRFTALFTACILALTAFGYALAFWNDGALTWFWYGSAARENYLNDKLGAHYAAARWVNAYVPQNAKLLFLWEPRMYYFAPVSDGDILFDRFVRLERLYGDAPHIQAALLAQGYTHVLLHREGLDAVLQIGSDPVTAQNMDTLNEFMRSALKPVYGRADLGLTTRNGRPALERAAQEPYAIYQLETP